ncbi:hypothetical protein KR054_009434 [Drosophila jambulina]|nr:hypothetical protein KR054_009434 [Drosophila jambulina]
MEGYLHIEDRDGIENQQIGDAAAGDAGNDEPHELRLRNQRQIYNVPRDPAVIQVVQGYNGLPRPLRPRKKRSIFTMTRKTLHHDDLYPSEMSALLINAKRAAMQAVSEEHQSEYFANYVAEHMTSQNYPNGVGLPDRWGQF